VPYLQDILAEDSHADRNERDRIYGVTIGIVTDNADTAHTYRVKLRLPKVPGGGVSDKTQDSTHWARIATGLAGEYIGTEDKFGPRGALFLPEIGDEVLVMFTDGDISSPVVIGRLWSDVAPKKSGGGGNSDDDGEPNKPIYSHTQLEGMLSDAIKAKPFGHAGTRYKLTEQRQKKNDVAGVRTRSGHLLIFNDNLAEPGGKHHGGILVRSSSGHRLEILDHEDQGIMLADSNGNYVWLQANSGEPKQTIEIKTTGDIKLESTDGNIIMTAKKNIEATSLKGYMKHEVTTGTYKVHSKGSLEIKTDSDGTIQGSTLQLRGKPINLN
jgi:hypothetical protein